MSSPRSGPSVSGQMCQEAGRRNGSDGGMDCQIVRGMQSAAQRSYVVAGVGESIACYVAFGTLRAVRHVACDLHACVESCEP